MVTLKEIANLANVSKSTVSRYLNNGSVSEKTKKKLDKIVKETGYQPNRLAQNLKSSKSSMIGVIISRYDSPSTNIVMKGIDKVAYKENIQLIITNSNLNLNRTKQNLLMLQRQKVGAIILFATTFDKELNKMIKDSPIPVIIIGQELEDYPSFIYDDYKAGCLIAQHALALGHKKILFVGVTEDDYAVGVLRKKGFMDVVNKAEVSTEFIESSFSRMDNYKHALEYLPDTEATYVAAATDHIAIGISNACAELGISIPQDISLSGFGGYGVTQNVYPHITTVNYPFYEMGEIVMKEIVQMNQTSKKINKKVTTLSVDRKSVV